MAKTIRDSRPSQRRPYLCFQTREGRPGQDSLVLKLANDDPRVNLEPLGELENGSFGMRKLNVVDEVREFCPWN